MRSILFQTIPVSSTFDILFDFLEWWTIFFEMKLIFNFLLGWDLLAKIGHFCPEGVKVLVKDGPIHILIFALDQDYKFILQPAQFHNLLHQRILAEVPKVWVESKTKDTPNIRAQFYSFKRCAFPAPIKQYSIPRIAKTGILIIIMINNHYSLPLINSGILIPCQSA